jgi:hypothetical protein
VGLRAPPRRQLRPWDPHGRWSHPLRLLGRRYRGRAFAGEALGDPDSLGLDAAFAALFLVLLVLQITSRRALAAAVLGGTIAFVLIPFTSPGVPIIAATAGCLVGWRSS